MSQRKDRLQTLYYCNYRCVCCDEKKEKLLVYKEIEEQKFILCRSCNELFRRKEYIKLKNRFRAIKGKKDRILTDKEKEFKKVISR